MLHLGCCSSPRSASATACIFDTSVFKVSKISKILFVLWSLYFHSWQHGVASWNFVLNRNTERKKSILQACFNILEVYFALAIRIFVNSQNEEFPGISSNGIFRIEVSPALWVFISRRFSIFPALYILVTILQQHQLINLPVPWSTSVLNYFASRKVRITFSVIYSDLRAKKLVEAFSLLKGNRKKNINKLLKALVHEFLCYLSFTYTITRPCANIIQGYTRKCSLITIAEPYLEPNRASMIGIFCENS